MANRLINETSPYLLQHAQNPVDWHPWGDEALERAKKEDKPILLSVGYSACHWCHVMERESFENQEIAQLMNENFVSIKVDREERPDIDSIYMTAVQAMTGRGGWPMTVFLTPEGKPFYGGTYFPPEDRGGLPAFPRILQAMAHAYSDDRESVTTATEQLIERMEQSTAVEQSRAPLTLDILQEAFTDVAMQFDSVYGGLGTAPKFPQPMTYEFLLRHYVRSEDPHALEIVELTLDRMAFGGIYDQIGGGFHRYSTDTFWLVPHFEKMLYDNALLARLYLHAYQVTGKQLYRRVVEETLDYVVREMSSPEGGFYSAQDADSEGVEGKFFVWTPAEIADALGEEDATKFSRYFDVTQQGNFEGDSILHPVLDADNAAKVLGMSEGELDDFLKRTRAKLLGVRDGRVHPGLDDKILTSWNGLMLRAFAEAAAVLAREDYAEIARNNAEFLCDNLRNEGRLLRTFKNGRARLNGYLEDYAFLIDGLISLHEVTFEERWLLEAADLGREMVDLFWNEDEERFYDTGSDHEELIIRPRDIMDNAIPSGSSMASDVLLRLALILGEPQLARIATAALRSVRDLMTRSPTGAGQWLGALDFYLSSAKEIAVIGRVDAAATRDLLAEVHRHYLPNRVLVGLSDDSDAIASLPLLEGREMIDGRPTAFVCQSYVCQLPVNDPGELAKQLVD